ncbi:hypothetical protein [Pseudochelatococcus contaminans]|uniref:Uncharacterized protein n=1 Tax=Pseudochelatococcus contaminans TaxID=1538103 RepID=A0A7W5Z5U6_9HYPH|nr:hypothetical protein [Pseudochelatococcus contaminans]MBB3810375.1 hypothetical protein [Pseudochelatococcus contaminans]
MKSLLQRSGDMAGSGFDDGRSCVANLHQVSHKPIERSFSDDLRLGLIVVNCKVRSIELFLCRVNRSVIPRREANIAGRLSDLSIDPVAYAQLLDRAETS